MALRFFKCLFFLMVGYLFKHFDISERWRFERYSILEGHKALFFGIEDFFRTSFLIQCIDGSPVSG